jgi:hypothetical protein
MSNLLACDTHFDADSGGTVSCFGNDCASGRPQTCRCDHSNSRCLSTPAGVFKRLRQAHRPVACFAVILSYDLRSWEHFGCLRLIACQKVRFGRFSALLARKHRKIMRLLGECHNELPAG